MDAVSLKLTNSDQCAMADPHVYEWLKTDPYLVKLKLLDFLHVHNTNRVVFNRSIRIANKQYKNVCLYLHNLIAGHFLGHLKTEKKNTVSAINGSFFDCRLENLIYRERGMRNRLANIEKGKTGYKGVHINGTRYKAVIYLDGKYKHLGYFPTARLAAICYNEHSLKHYGETAFLNTIPDTDPEQHKLISPKRIWKWTKAQPDLIRNNDVVLIQDLSDF